MMLRSPFWLLTCLASVVASGCSDHSDSISFSPRKLKLGTSVVFMIQQTDSVLSDNLLEQRKHLQKGIHFTVIDTVDGFTIEWNEQHLLSTPDSLNIQNNAEWVPFYRIIYHCDREGMIDNVVNYQEVRSVVDPLVAMYIEQTGMADDPRIETFLSYFMDSTRLMTRLLTDAELIHRLYGITVADGDTAEFISYSPYTDPTMTAYTVVLDKSPMCSKEYVGVKSWSEPVSTNLKDVLPVELMDLKQLSALELPKAISIERLSACFDPERSLVTYLDFQRRMQMDTVTLVQRILVYELE